MSEQSSEPIEIVLESSASDEDTRAVQELFAEFGIATSMLVRLQESEDEMAWLVMISAPIGIFLGNY